MPEWAWVWRAWQHLDSGRTWLSGMTVVPRRLSWSDIVGWADRHCLSADEVDDLQHLLGEMEAEFEAVYAERRAAAT
nr:hypothetical protein [uncultured Roseococcus sp.]